MTFTLWEQCHSLVDNIIWLSGCRIAYFLWIHHYGHFSSGISSADKSFPRGCTCMCAHAGASERSLCWPYRNCLGITDKWWNRSCVPLRKSKWNGLGKHSKGLKKVFGVLVLSTLNLHRLCEVIFKQSTPMPSYNSSFQISQTVNRTKPKAKIKWRQK